MSLYHAGQSHYLDNGRYVYADGFNDAAIAFKRMRDMQLIGELDDSARIESYRTIDGIRNVTRYGITIPG